jgi:hypothetical protein
VAADICQPKRFDDSFGGLGVRDISTVSHGEKRVANGLWESGAETKRLKGPLDIDLFTYFKPDTNAPNKEAQNKIIKA